MTEKSKKKNPLVLNPMEDAPVSDKAFDVKEEKVQEAIKEVEKDIPSSYIPIYLVSNGRIEGVPSVLHFRDYSASDALDINTLDEDDRPKVLGNVLKRMCFEKYDISTLPIQDVLYILYVLQGSFISPTIEKDIYIDDKLPEGDDEGCIDNVANIEKVEIPISSIHTIYLGKDKDDKDLPVRVKIPFTLTNKETGDKIKLKLASLKDSVVADSYCKDYFRSDLLRFADIRKSLSEIQQIRKEAVRQQKLDEFLLNNEEKSTEYFKFMSTYALMVAKVMQALQIVSYNGKELKEITEKWEIYNSISSEMWENYNKVIADYPFGLVDEITVYSNKLQKNVTRRVGFQLSEFLSFNRAKNDERYGLSFD